jgi:hypothetical protein
VAETNALLKRHTGNRIEGSNPSVSARACFSTALERPRAHKNLRNSNRWLIINAF